jgi:hypothetical protein
MRKSHYAIAAVLTFAACNPFRSPLKQDPVVEVTRDANLNSRWSGSLASPANLAGAVQIRGVASMTPATQGGAQVNLDLSNATPGGVHPWQLRRGQCGADEGEFGQSDKYQAVKINDQGRGSSNAVVSETMPTDGRFYVRVGASAANAETVVACGNLAAPSR